MRESLLLVERIIIESLSKKEKNIFELEVDTNLNQRLLLNILPNLLMKNIIKYNRGLYQIEKEVSLSWSTSINSKLNIKEEVKELFTTMVNEYFSEEKKMTEKNSQLKIQKIWLTEAEEKILNGYLISLENFFKGIREARQTQPLKERTYEQKVIVWGISNYSDLIDGVLQAV